MYYYYYVNYVNFVIYNNNEKKNYVSF